MKKEEILRKPLVLTEKGSRLNADCHQVSFEVARTANKFQIKHAVESFFKVRVKSVNTLIVRGQMRRMGRSYVKAKNSKKAIVTLAPGESIDFFQN